MKKAVVLCMALTLLAGCFAGCESNTAGTGTVPTASQTEPAPTVTGIPVSPTETEPQIKPEPITPQGAIAENMALTVTVGDQAEQTVENPLASFIYNYIVSQRKTAQEKMPPAANKDYNSTAILLTFTVGENQAIRMYLYEDDYASIATSPNSENTAWKHYKFSDGAYASVLLTLQQQ